MRFQIDSIFQALSPVTTFRRLWMAVAIGWTAGKLVPSPQPTIPSAVSTRANTQGAYPRTPVSKKGSTLTILREDSCAPGSVFQKGIGEPVANTLPVMPHEARLRKARRELLLVSPLSCIKFLSSVPDVDRFHEYDSVIV